MEHAAATVFKREKCKLNFLHFSNFHLTAAFKSKFNVTEAGIEINQS